MSPIFASLFEIVGGGVLLVAGVLGAVWLVNRRAGRDLLTAGRAQVGKFGSAARNADPQAVIHQEIRDAQAELSRSITDLEESKGMVGELKDQTDGDQRKVAAAEAKVRVSLSDDPDDAGGKAAEYVMQLEAHKKNLARNSEQLKTAQTMYASNLEKYQLAAGKIRQVQERARNLGQEVKSSEVSAKLARLAQKFNVNVDGLDSTLAEAESEARRQIARNNAVGEVQTDLGTDGLAEAKEEERLRKAEAKLKLEEYRKNMGLVK